MTEVKFRYCYYTASSSVIRVITLLNNVYNFFSPGGGAWWRWGVTGYVPTNVKIKPTPLLHAPVK